MTSTLPPDILDSIRYISKRMSKIENSVRGLAQESGLGVSSIDDGSIDIVDGDGNVTGTIGGDGFGQIFTVLGPPTPEDPDVLGIYDSIVIAYDGTFTDGDWEENLVDHVEIHATAGSGDPLDDTTQIGTFTSSNGGIFNYPWHAIDGGRYIHLISVTIAGEEGTPSNAVLGVPDAVAPTDGVSPAAAPVVTVRPGIQSVFASWPAVTNNDPVQYRVYAKNGSAPSTSGTTDLIATTPQTSIVISTLPGPVQVTQAMTIHVKVIAFDHDGDSPTSTDQSAAPSQITTIDITPANITGTTIANDAITSPKIAANTIVAADIAAHTITANEITANTITASEIAANTITAAQIAANTITASQIAATTITAAQIAANTITASQIAAGTITATQIASATITTTQLTSTAIDGMTITGAIFQTAGSGNRMIVKNDVSGGIIYGYSGGVGEVTPASINPNAPIGGHNANLLLSSPTFTSQYAATLGLFPGVSGVNESYVEATADLVVVNELSWGAHNGFVGGGTGVPISQGIDFGSKSVTTNASGDFSITHKFVNTPAAVFVFSQTGTFLDFRVTSLSSSACNFRAWNVGTGAVHASATFTVSYMFIL